MPAFVPLAERLVSFTGRMAIVDPSGAWTYEEIDGAAIGLAALLREERGVVAGARIALLCSPGRDFVVGLLACWRVGAIAVPLHPQHPDAEIAYAMSDSGTSVIIASGEHAPLAARVAAALAIDVVDVNESRPGPPDQPASPDQPGLMVYTSGTTGRPKGVVHTHASVAAMVDGLLEAWAWSAEDRIVLVLPLNHVHGIVNVTLCAVAAGACCEAPGRFDAVDVWDRLASSDVTVFMAVPTIYARLIAAWDDADRAVRRRWSEGAAGLRLMVSGSAALPVSTLERWRDLTGHVLLERYGMTEIGMALSNTLTQRVPGHVGEPLPGVELRIVDERGDDVIEGQPGELLVRGPQLFAEYWRRPAETAAAFTDGWFRTGDVAVHDAGGHRLLGRSSVDIIKTGGEKVSALEIEEVYRTHPAVADCAVVGLDDIEWGQRVAVAVVLAAGHQADGDSLRAWGKQHLAASKVPSRYAFVPDLPRNTLGKVVKASVGRLF